MPRIGWDKFEWDDENRKNGNVQHLRDHGIEPEEAEECFFTLTLFAVMNGVLMKCIFWRVELIAAEDCL
jgi:hypothetical protein